MKTKYRYYCNKLVMVITWDIKPFSVPNVWSTEGPVPEVGLCPLWRVQSKTSSV